MGRESRAKKPTLSLRNHLLAVLRDSQIRRVAFWYAVMARPPEWVPDRVLAEPPAAALAKSLGPTSTAADVDISVQNLIDCGAIARLPDGRMVLAGDDGPLTPRRIANILGDHADDSGRVIDAVDREDLASAVQIGMSALVMPGQKLTLTMTDRGGPPKTYSLNANSPLHRFTFAVATHFGYEKATALVARWIGVELLRRDVRMSEWIKEGRPGPLIHPAIFTAAATQPLRNAGDTFHREGFFRQLAFHAASRQAITSFGGRSAVATSHGFTD